MLIVNPNFTIDRTIPLDTMVPGSVHRTGPATASLGGKGVNVARVARAFGRPGVLVGFMPSTSAPELAMLAAAEGAELAGVPVAGIVRAASIFLERSGRVTVFNEPGPTVDEVDWSRLLAEVQRRAGDQQTVVCSGSLPPGSPVDGYARVVATARAAGLRSVVDSTGEVLASALSAHPDVVSPNLAEAETLVFGPAIEGVEPEGELVIQRAVEAAQGLVARGARRAIVSAGSHGAAFSDGSETLFLPAPEVSVVSPIGAGDSLVAGLVLALEEDQPFKDAVRFALAVASASCEQPVAGAVDPNRARELAAAVGTP
ncbi:MAG TPA: hexose kinase [Solirubrobacteraceae bacterium]|nr:hexose kinase [Solirubrobacteraceae bacterium]